MGWQVCTHHHHHHHHHNTHTMNVYQKEFTHTHTPQNNTAQQNRPTQQMFHTHTHTHTHTLNVCHEESFIFSQEWCLLHYNSPICTTFAWATNSTTKTSLFINRWICFHLHFCRPLLALKYFSPQTLAHNLHTQKASVLNLDSKAAGYCQHHIVHVLNRDNTHCFCLCSFFISPCACGTTSVCALFF